MQWLVCETGHLLLIIRTGHLFMIRVVLWNAASSPKETQPRERGPLYVPLSQWPLKRYRIAHIKILRQNVPIECITRAK